MRRPLASAILASLLVASWSLVAHAGPVSDENAKPGTPGGWTAGDDGTAQFAGVVDVYPAAWSIAPGEPLRLKIRSTTDYDVRVFRLGWYGGVGQRQIALVSGQPANAQPYPVADATYGLAEAKWSDSVTVATDASWTTGLYVARVEQPSGKQATTFFTVRDDGAATRQPILFVVGINTHQAYNCWPGPTLGGKSLYGFNSSPTHPSEDITGLTQAVKVSFDRPFFVGGGTADVSNYEYPFVRWAEKSGYEMAYATDQDLHRDPAIAKGRRVVAFSGHEEYTSWEMFDAAVAARDSGTNFLFLSGDTFSWQVRYESGAGGALSTLVGYKENHSHDPLERAGYKALNAGQIDAAKASFSKVSRGWKNLYYDPTTGIDVRRPGMILTGVQSAGIIRNAAGQPTSAADYPWADLVITDPSFWIYAGTNMVGGDTIPGVFGYEVDSTESSNPEMDPWRKPGQRVFGAIREVSDGKVKGSSAWYRADSGAEVVAMGAIVTSWALDDFAASMSGHAGTVSANYQRMIANVFDRFLSATPPPPPPPAPDGGIYDAGPMADADPVEKEGGTFTEVGPEPTGGAGASSGPSATGGTAQGATTSSSGGCSFGARGDAAAFAFAGALAGVIAVLRRRDRR